MDNSMQWIAKSRRLTNLRSFQLIRERLIVNQVTRGLPGKIDGIEIKVPNMRLSIGWSVKISTPVAAGRDLFQYLYRQAPSPDLIPVGLAILRALDQTDVKIFDSALMRKLYFNVRWNKLIRREYRQPVLSTEERNQLDLLLKGYSPHPERKKVLVHGDLHVANIIYNQQTKTVTLLDFELTHTGKGSINFTHLWISYLFADRALGNEFMRKYIEQFELDNTFFDDLRAEIALRCYSMIWDARKSNNQELEQKSISLLKQVIVASELSCLYE